jgi:hypothetical protein
VVGAATLGRVFITGGGESPARGGTIRGRSKRHAEAVQARVPVQSREWGGTCVGRGEKGEQKSEETEG